MPRGMRPIFTQRLSSSNQVIIFQNIPQTFTDLCLVMSIRADSNTGVKAIGAYFNGTAYPASASWRTMVGNGSSASSSVTSGYNSFGNVADAAHTANTFSYHNVMIPNYTSNLFKQYTVKSVSEHNGTAAQIVHISGMDRINAPITSIQMDLGGNNFLANSTFTLYGIGR